MNTKIAVSVIIPVYNEEKDVANCLKSLINQSHEPQEIVVIDDGSQDKTCQIIRNLFLPNKTSQSEIKNLVLLEQNHHGPGPARNLGASHAKGKILVFVDSDMTFDKNFIRDLIRPITRGETIGTFSKNELNANKDNTWSICWNINRNLPIDRLIPPDYPNKAPVFRAILKEKFDQVGGFDATGEYTDDWSLSRKLKQKSTLARGAIYYHSNPATLQEVYKQARWIGKNEFISGNLLRRARSLLFYSLPISLVIGITKSILHLNFYFLIFKLNYDFAIWVSVIKSFFGEAKYK